MRGAQREGRAETAVSGWIEATPKTMPPVHTPVMVTWEPQTGDRVCGANALVVWTGKEWVEFYGGPALYIERDTPCRTTHWMPYPALAED